MSTDNVVAVAPYVLLLGYVLLSKRRTPPQKLVHVGIAVAYALILGGLWLFGSKEGAALAYWFYFAITPTLHLAILLISDAWRSLDRSR